MKTAAILSLLPLALALPGQKRSAGSAPVLKPRDVEALLEDKYIVKMKDDATQASIDHVDGLFEGEAYAKWDADKKFKGLAAQIPAEALEAIAKLEDVSVAEYLLTTLPLCPLATLFVPREGVDRCLREQNGFLTYFPYLGRVHRTGCHHQDRLRP
jgi:hypothetical protein